MSKKVKFTKDNILEMLYEANAFQILGNSAMLSTKFEGNNISDDVVEKVTDLKVAMESVDADLNSLKDLYYEINKMKSDIDKNIKTTL